MTSLVFSLTLGFIIFISIVSKIPFMKEVSDGLMHSGHSTLRFKTYNLPIADVDKIIKKYEYAFEGGVGG